MIPTLVHAVASPTTNATPFHSRGFTAGLLAIGAAMGSLTCSVAAQSLQFSRPTDTISFQPWCVTVPDQITYEAVFRLDVPQNLAAGHIYTEHRAAWWDRQFGISATGIYEYTHPIDQGAGWAAPAAIAPHVWHHIAFCYDGQQERLYLDGQLLASRSRTGSIFSACGAGFPGGGVANIGWCRRTDGFVTPSFIGSMDSFRVSATARYSGASFVPPTGDLGTDAATVLQYNFNECSGTIAIDSGPFSRTGTLGGGATIPTRQPLPAPSVYLTGSPACVGANESLVLDGESSGTYQWRRAGSPISTIANPSAATATLTLTNISAADAGSYDCIVTNACGSITSNAADLNVDCNCLTNYTTTVTAGVPDAFSTDNGLEMGTPRPEFAAHLAQRLPGRDLLQFDSDSRDEVDYNRFVAHSFTGLPADITAATVTTRVRAGGTNAAGNEGTDSVSIGHSFSDTDFQGYKRFFGNENSPFLFNFPWRRYTASPQCDQTFTTPPLDAAVINRMNTLGYLDFLVGDDSGVDYVTLQYTRAGPVPSGINVAWIRSQPVSVGSACAGTSAGFSVTPAGTGPFTYQWRNNGNPIDSLANPSAATATLTLTNVTAADVASYDCIVTGACGSVTSNPATLSICPADFNCDGGIDGSDVGAFFDDWEAGNAIADTNADGGIDGADVSTFFEHWEAGC